MLAELYGCAAIKWKWFTATLTRAAITKMSEQHPDAFPSNTLTSTITAAEVAVIVRSDADDVVVVDVRNEQVRSSHWWNGRYCKHVQR